jgi:CelD/BcsL family acetyltransferase involved in cellulose biosynthesis
LPSGNNRNIASAVDVEGYGDAPVDLEVRLDRTDRCFELPEWRELLARDPDRHIFATPEWHRVWWDEFGAGKDLFVLTMCRGAEVLAIVPLYRKHEGRRKILRFLGGIDLTDYLGPICAPEDRDLVAATLVRWLSETDVEWDEFDAHNMPVPFGFAEFLVDHVDRQGYRFILDQEETAALLLLPDDWDAYLAGLRGKERHELKRKRRRLEREHPDATVRRSTPETIDTDLKIFVEMHRGAEGMKGHFMRPEIATFFERMAVAFEPLGWLRLDFLEIAEHPVASTFGFEVNGVFYLYNSAFEPEAQRLSPGLVLVSELVKGAIEGNLRVFDFLRGPERYKYQLGAEAVPLNNVRVLAAEDR